MGRFNDLIIELGLDPRPALKGIKEFDKELNKIGKTFQANVKKSVGKQGLSGFNLGAEKAKTQKYIKAIKDLGQATDEYQKKLSKLKTPKEFEDFRKDLKKTKQDYIKFYDEVNKERITDVKNYKKSEDSKTSELKRQLGKRKQLLREKSKLPKTLIESSVMGQQSGKSAKDSATVMQNLLKQQEIEEQRVAKLKSDKELKRYHDKRKRQAELHRKRLADEDRYHKESQKNLKERLKTYKQSKKLKQPPVDEVKVLKQSLSERKKLMKQSQDNFKRSVELLTKKPTTGAKQSASVFMQDKSWEDRTKTAKHSADVFSQAFKQEEELSKLKSKNATERFHSRRKRRAELHRKRLADENKFNENSRKNLQSRLKDYKDLKLKSTLSLEISDELKRLRKDGVLKDTSAKFRLTDNIDVVGERLRKTKDKLTRVSETHKINLELERNNSVERIDKIKASLSDLGKSGDISSTKLDALAKSLAKLKAKSINIKAKADISDLENKIKNISSSKDLAKVETALGRLKTDLLTLPKPKTKVLLDTQEALKSLNVLEKGLTRFKRTTDTKDLDVKVGSALKSLSKLESKTYDTVSLMKKSLGELKVSDIKLDVKSGLKGLKQQTKLDTKADYSKVLSSLKKVKSESTKTFKEKTVDIDYKSNIEQQIKKLKKLGVETRYYQAKLDTIKDPMDYVKLSRQIDRLGEQRMKWLARAHKKEQDILLSSGYRRLPQEQKEKFAKDMSGAKERMMTSGDDLGFRALKSDIREFRRSMVSLQTVQMGLADSTKHMIRSYASLFALVEATNAIKRVGMDFQSVDASMLAASSSAEDAQAKLKFVSKESRRLGVDLVTASKAYMQLSIAAKGVFEQKDIDNLFVTTMEAATAFGMSLDDTKGSFRAFIQMISKGNVQA